MIQGVPNLLGVPSFREHFIPSQSLNERAALDYGIFTGESKRDVHVCPSFMEQQTSYKLGKWSPTEHSKFIEAVEFFGSCWVKVSEHIGTRSPAQIRSHAQKYFRKKRHEKIREIKKDPLRKSEIFAITKECRANTTKGAYVHRSKKIKEETTNRIAIPFPNYPIYTRPTPFDFISNPSNPFCPYFLSSKLLPLNFFNPNPSHP